MPMPSIAPPPQIWPKSVPTSGPATGCIGAFIAEMDYGLAPYIQQAIDSACDHCKLGYIPEPWKRRVAEACAGWQKSHYGWDVDPDIIRVVPDVLEAYEIFLRELVGAGNAVVVLTPAYMPFLACRSCTTST